MIAKRSILPIIALSTALSLTACSAHDITQREMSGATHAAAQHTGAVHNTGSGIPAENQSEKRAGNYPVLDLTNKQALETILPRLSRDRVVYVGETHDRYDHHLNQLEVIRRLHRIKPDMAIGMEFFQQPFQSVLDDYISGRISEKEMLLGSEWYDRWRYDYRLYRPIMQYAREHGIPVIALNVARELTDRVSKVGIDGLTQAERAQFPPEIETGNERYRQRIQEVYRTHPHADNGGFERFLEVQLAWDEGMAERVVRYLREHPDRTMVVLAGSGHLMYGTGIPDRVQRRLPVAAHLLLPADSIVLHPGIADFVVFTEPAELPRAGLMGVLLDQAEQGVRVGSVVSGSAAEQAGMEEGDIIQRLNGETVNSTADIKIGMLDQSPGAAVELQVLRKRLVLGEKLLQFEFALGGD